MQKISTNFKRSEFACKCGCGFDAVDVELLEILELIRRYYSAPVRITSGNRCVEHNKAVGGSADSQHTKGKAADISVDGVEARDVALYLEENFLDRYGIGRYESWTHIDVREAKARWGG